MAEQIPLDLPAGRPAASGRAEFFPSPANRLALAAVDAWQGWPEGKLVLAGPPGSGKSHLARIWAAETGALRLGADEVELALATPGATPPATRVAVEDVPRICGDRAAEEALFHLHNRLRAEGGRLLMTGRGSPERWDFALPDLASRVRAAQLAELGAPDDALLSAVLVKLFADRQLAPHPRLIRWLVPRIERSFAAAQQVVVALDARALATGRALNVELAREVVAD